MNIKIYNDKRKRCYNKDKRHHNLYGPDEIHCNGGKTYYINGNCHNVHGPAIIYRYDDVRYFLDGDKLTKKRWEQLRHEY